MYRLFAELNISSQVYARKVQGITKVVYWQPYMVQLVALVLLIYVVSTVTSISTACTSSLVGA
jgi:hypothetical protein